MKKSSFLFTLPMTWLILESIYLASQAQGWGPKIDCLDVCTHPAMPYGFPLVSFLGMFVPVGLNNFFLFFFPVTGWIAGFILVFSLLRGETYLQRYKLEGTKKLLANFAYLFVLTYVVDAVTTWFLFFNGTGIQFISPSIGYFFGSIIDLFKGF